MTLEIFLKATPLTVPTRAGRDTVNAEYTDRRVRSRIVYNIIILIMNDLYSTIYLDTVPISIIYHTISMRSK